MAQGNNQLAQHAFEVMVVFLVLGSLSMIWPSIMALTFGFFLLLQSLGVEQQLAVLSSAEISNFPAVYSSLRRSDSPTILL